MRLWVDSHVTIHLNFERLNFQLPTRYGWTVPTPVGHALGGLIVGLLASRAPTDASSPSRAWLGTSAERRFLLLCAFVACLPDLDFGWGRHNMETHSIGFAALVGLAVWAWRRSPRAALACGFAVGTHVLFDWLGSDDFPPLGVMALWPFSHEFYFANAFVFQAISRRYWLPGFVQHNLLAVLREIAILAPIVAVLWWRKRSIVGRTLIQSNDT